VIEAYNFRCAICGLKINSPDLLSWEVEAAHIVPNRSLGRDDIWNGIALCHLHHWAFDVGWFTLSENYHIEVSSLVHRLPADYGKMGTRDIIRSLGNRAATIRLPRRTEIFPHQNAIFWHRRHIFLANQA
jgi:predicted restriction endonuclease